MPLPTAAELTDPNATNTQMKQRLGQLIQNIDRSYETIDLANADIANIPVGVTVLIKSKDGGFFYKQNSDSTTLKRLSYDPILYSDSKFNTGFAVGDNVYLKPNGLHYVKSSVWIEVRKSDVTQYGFPSELQDYEGGLLIQMIGDASNRYLTITCTDGGFQYVKRFALQTPESTSWIAINKSEINNAEMRAYDRAISESKLHTNKTFDGAKSLFAKESEISEERIVITDQIGNPTWMMASLVDGMPVDETVEVMKESVGIADFSQMYYGDEEILHVVKDENGYPTSILIRKSDGMFANVVIQNIKERLNLGLNEIVPADFRTYGALPSFNMLKSISAGIMRHIEQAPLPATPFDFVDSLGQGARIYLPANYNDSTPIPLVMVFDGVGSGEGGTAAPTVRSQFTSVLLQNGVAVCKSQAHGNSYGNPACMQSYLEVFQKACEIAPIGAVILMGNSMGGIAAQNALLTNSIPNISGLYLTDPTYDLRQRYDNGRKPEITSAYGIASDGSDYAEKTAGYDPALRHWSQYRGVPVHIRASSGDTSVVLGLHGQKLKTYLAQHNDVTLTDTGTAGHNTTDRFDGTDLLNFINKCIK